MMQSAYGHSDQATALDYRRVRQAIQKALELDPAQPDAYEVLGWIKVIDDLDWPGSEDAFRKAYSLAPGNSRMVEGMATFLHCSGQMEQALHFSSEAIQIDPLNPEAYMIHARTQFLAGHLAEAEGAYEKALQLSPGMATAHYMLGLVLLAQGRAQDGLQEVEKEPSAGYRSCGKAIVLHHLGRSQESDAALAALLAEGEQWSVQFAAVHAERGECDKAFAALERAYELRDSGLPLTKVSPFLNNLHSDPRWPVFLRKIGLTA
jgi:serine/threonine-protein kinase